MIAAVPAIDELALVKQWVVWRLEPPLEGKDKPRKVPYNARDGKPASTTDQRTWATFDEACIAAPLGFTGLGFVFTANDPYIGVDLDGCLKNGVIAGWAADIVERLKTYTEVSPSGNGLHLIIRGKLPAVGRRSGPIEMYETQRYFTMSAEKLSGTPEFIYDRSLVIAQIHAELFGDHGLVIQPRTTAKRQHPERTDDELLERMFASRSGSEIRWLWDGKVGRYDDDDSRADLALCAHLLYWTSGDTVRADRLFRQSLLYRPKWDQRRGEQTYGERTLFACVKHPTRPI